jgi:hypothetical protein
MRCICIYRSGAQSRPSLELSKSSQNPPLPHLVQRYHGSHTHPRDHARHGPLQCSSTPPTHRRSCFHNLDRIASRRPWMEARRHQTAILSKSLAPGQAMADYQRVSRAQRSCRVEPSRASTALLLPRFPSAPIRQQKRQPRRQTKSPASIKAAAPLAILAPLPQQDSHGVLVAAQGRVRRVLPQVLLLAHGARLCRKALAMLALLPRRGLRSVLAMTQDQARNIRHQVSTRQHRSHLCRSCWHPALLVLCRQPSRYPLQLISPALPCPRRP